MRVLIITPADRRSRKGNRLTAVRWSRLLRELGHQVQISVDYAGHACDVMIALHARKSAPMIARFRRERPEGRLVVTLTGTDLYHDLAKSAAARTSLDLADRLILLQPDGRRFLPAKHRDKANVVIQSALPLKQSPPPLERTFEICVIGHLRTVKDPFRAALAARRLPDESRIGIVHLGGALTDAMARQAEREQQRNPRYRWLGDIPRWQARRYLARSRLMVLSSRLEGGANVLSESIAVGTPVLASRISGSIGILGERYAGYFEVGDTEQLAKLMQRAEQDNKFLATLKRHIRKLQPQVQPKAERAALAQVIK